MPTTLNVDVVVEGKTGKESLRAYWINVSATPVRIARN